MIESRHMPIREELEANLFGEAVRLPDSPVPRDYWTVLNRSGNERCGNETNTAEKIVFQYA
jgi:hypothetical protein